MKVKFEIEYLLKIGKSKNAKYFIFAKCLEMDKQFDITENSRLGGIEISKFIGQPRYLDKEGNPRFDIFSFKIRYKKDYDVFVKGQIVELTNH